MSQSVKTLIVGSLSCGKTTLCNSMFHFGYSSRNGPFPLSLSHYSPTTTIGVEFHSFEVPVHFFPPHKDSDSSLMLETVVKHVKFSVWEIGGKSEGILSSYADEVKISLVCFDSTDRRSFEEVESKWIQVIPDSGSIVLVSMKNDVKPAEVTDFEVQQLADLWNAAYVKVSMGDVYELASVLAKIVSNSPKPVVQVESPIAVHDSECCCNLYDIFPKWQ